MVRDSAQTRAVRRGRPPIAAQSVRVSLRIPVETYDRLDRIARRRDTSVPDVIRRKISAQENPPVNGITDT
jgi:hypothetical protein